MENQETQGEEKHSTICVGHRFTQTNTNNVNNMIPPTNNKVKSNRT